MSITRITAGLLVSGALATGLALAAAPAHAAPDPSTAITCLAEGATDITSLVDPSAPGVPAEVPNGNCLQP